jgi:hypothetical protein
MLRLAGIANGSGLVQKSGQSVAPQTELFTASTDEATFSSYELTVPNASDHFDAIYLRSPGLLFGYDVFPNASGAAGFQIIDASYSRSADTMTIVTRVGDSPMTFALDNNNPVWSIRPKFFRVNTTGLKDSLPDSTAVRLEFQAADELAPGTNTPGAPVPGVNQWTSNLASLKGNRFIRYRVTFEADALSEGMDLNSPLPILDYLKLPFVW